MVQRLPAPAQVVRLQRRPPPRGEDEPVLIPARRGVGPLGGLALAVLPKCLHAEVGQRDGVGGVAGLRRHRAQRPAGELKRVGGLQAPGVEVDVLPAQPQQFPAPQAEAEREDVQRVKAIARVAGGRRRLRPHDAVIRPGKGAVSRSHRAGRSSPPDPSARRLPKGRVSPSRRPGGQRRCPVTGPGSPRLPDARGIAPPPPVQGAGTDRAPFPPWPASRRTAPWQTSWRAGRCGTAGFRTPRSGAGRVGGDPAWWDARPHGRDGPPGSWPRAAARGCCRRNSARRRARRRASR
ncbi:hypothetical protein SAMN02745673_02438 [Marinactinospora thermotolerans DSM 45154]|uniref:Uncharacterized protein n=1 Tax=Marinactinospora thermotolerans DSM 45154 TaxID=1122192 RepID=A0A1T4R1N2_9ACTN|nr:hypothetical protein SAMN02745673_02438 [Marinactinospora thermotolerans DSM 45154]